MKADDGKLDNVVSFKSSCESTVQETASLEQTGEIASANTEIYGSQKDNNFSLIRMQLVQIENQQSNLLEILQVCSLYFVQDNFFYVSFKYSHNIPAFEMLSLVVNEVCDLSSQVLSYLIMIFGPLLNDAYSI